MCVSVRVRRGGAFFVYVENEGFQNNLPAQAKKSELNCSDVGFRYRAQVIESKGNEKLRLRFIDWGNEEDVTLSPVCLLFFTLFFFLFPLLFPLILLLFPLIFLVSPIIFLLFPLSQLTFFFPRILLFPHIFLLLLLLFFLFMIFFFFICIFSFFITFFCNLLPVRIVFVKFHRH